MLLRTEVSETRIIDISPLESSLASVLAQTAQLQSLERRFSMLSQTVSDRAKLNTNVLLTALNASLDTGEDEGVPFWRSVFLERGSTIGSPPAVQSLAAAIDDYVRTSSGQAGLTQRRRWCLCDSYNYTHSSAHPR